jgi:hypothetical protein
VGAAFYNVVCACFCWGHPGGSYFKACEHNGFLLQSHFQMCARKLWLYFRMSRSSFRRCTPKNVANTRRDTLNSDCFLEGALFRETRWCERFLRKRSCVLSSLIFNLLMYTSHDFALYASFSCTDTGQSTERLLLGHEQVCCTNARLRLWLPSFEPQQAVGAFKLDNSCSLQVGFMLARAGGRSLLKGVGRPTEANQFWRSPWLRPIACSA